MRARAVRGGAEPRSEAAATRARRPSVAALVFLRGRDADGRLRELVAERAQERPVLGALAAVLLGERLSPTALVGSVLILAAVALASRDKGEEAPVGPDVVPEQTGVQPGEEQ